MIKAKFGMKIWIKLLRSTKNYAFHKYLAMKSKKLVSINLKE